MDLLSRCYFKNVLFRICVKKIGSATSLAHSKGPVDKEKSSIYENTECIKIDKQTIYKLEKISLVDFANEGGIQRLEASIQFAQKLKDVHIDPSVKPMYSVLENEKLELREDKISEGDYRDKILKKAKILEDEYFVAPPGNIPKSS